MSNIQYLDINGLAYYDARIKQFIEDNIPEAAEAFVNAIVESGEPEILKIAVCTQETYDDLGDNWEENTLYIISDDNTLTQLTILINSVSVKIGDMSYTQDSNHVITLPEYPTRNSLQINNVSNDKQIKGLPSGQTTEDHILVFGADGYTVKDSGKTVNNLEVTDLGVTLSTDLYTNYNVGKIINASGTNPVLIGHTGDTLRTLFNNLFVMDELQPAIESQPEISTLSFSNQPSSSNERGTAISTINYSLTTSNGRYTYDTSTGVTWSNYQFSGDNISTVGKTTTEGELTLSSNYIVGTTSELSITCTGTHSAGNIAHTNLGNSSNPPVQIEAGTTDNSNVFSITAIDYPYYISSSSSSIPTNPSKADTALATTTGINISYASNGYIWIYIRKGSTASQPTKTIQLWSEFTQSWTDMLGGTVAAGTVTIQKANGVTDTFFAYRTVNTAAEAGTAKIRIIN